MKTYEKLPDTITLNDGLVLKHRRCNDTGLERLAREQGLKFRVIGVRDKNLKRRVDLHGEPYKPTEWIFTDKPLGSTSNLNGTT